MTRETGTPPRFNFSDMTALVVDGNEFARSFTRNIFAGFRFREIVTVGTAREAIAILGARQIDVVITEWHFHGMSGGTLVKGIRTLPKVRDNQVPVIVLSAAAQLDAVCGARDAGANDFISRPLVLGTFLPRMTHMISEPRPFVRSASYCGPDRRRKQQPFKGPNRRDRPLNDAAVAASPLVRSLGDKMRRAGGLSVSEMVENGEAIIAEEAGRYAEVRREDIRELMQAIREFKEPGSDTKTLAEQIYLKSHDLRGMGDTFGMPLLSAAGASLCRMLWSLTPDRFREMVIIQGIETHAMVMSLVVSENILGDGGEMGDELMSGLEAISGKLRPAVAASA